MSYGHYFCEFKTIQNSAKFDLCGFSLLNFPLSFVQHDPIV